MQENSLTDDQWKNIMCKKNSAESRIKPFLKGL
jgi:hypothetical protein